MKRLMCATVAAFLLGGRPWRLPLRRGSHGSTPGRTVHDTRATRFARTFTSCSPRARRTIIRNHYAPAVPQPAAGTAEESGARGAAAARLAEEVRAVPVVVERRLPVLPPEYRRGVIDGHAVIYNTRSHVIVDVAVLF